MSTPIPSAASPAHLPREASGIPAILARTRVIAVVGLSANPTRASHEVAAYLQARGLRIVPVNPAHVAAQAARGGSSDILGEQCHASLADAAAALAKDGQAIDMVDVFRRAEETPEVAREAVAIGARTLWLQLGISSHEAAAIASAGGLDVVMDRCTKIEYARQPHRPATESTGGRQP